jgi:uncharacterized Tic20 family protein
MLMGNHGSPGEESAPGGEGAGRPSGGSSKPEPWERRAAAIAHGSALLMFFFPLGNMAGPFIVYTAAGRNSIFVTAHAVRALIYQGAVSLVAWTLFALAMMHGWGPDAHFAALGLSYIPVLLAAARALSGKLPKGVSPQIL